MDAPVGIHRSLHERLGDPATRQPGRVEVVDALRALGGTARWQDLRGHVSWRAIQRAKRDGSVHRDGDAYSVSDTDRTLVMATRLRGVRSHVTAAAHHGLALPPGTATQVHITIPHQAKRKVVPDEVQLHYRDHPPGSKPDGDVTTVTETLIDCLRDEPLRVALSVGDSALAAGKVRRQHLEDRAAALRGPGSAVVRDRIAMLDGRAANAFESCARAIVIAAGILGFEPQVDIRRGRQWIGRVDLADRLLRIVIECDGFETHGGRDAFVRDLVRFTWLVSAGWRPLRFTWEQVMFAPEWVLERICDTIADVEASRVALTTAQRRSRTAGARS